MERASSPAFGDVLKQARVAAGLTQEDLAERSGVSARSIRNLERGAPHRPRKDTLRLLAAALNLSPAEEVLFSASAQALRRPRAAAADEAAASTFPLPPTPLIGRENEMRAISALLQTPQVRLLTLTGTGGVGKTHLALEVASRLSPFYGAGRTFVDLARLRSPDLVLSAIADALALREYRSHALLAALQAQLQQRRWFLLLDNFEHLLPAALQVRELLALCPQLTLLVTSRAALQVRGEQLYTLRPLAVPDAAQEASPATLAQVPAMALLVARAQALQPDFVLADANAATLAAICRRLDGLPLAIELATVRLIVLSPEALLARLDQRLALLTQGAQDLPARQQALRATLDWSYDLLAAQEQALLRGLAVFAGGADLEAIERVCPSASGRVLDRLNRLISHSLVSQAPSEADEPRFRMLETIREYAWEHLASTGEAEATARAHARCYLALAEATEPELTGPNQASWLGRLASEQDNLRAALQWAQRQGEAEVGLRLAGALWRFWLTRGALAEGRQWLDTFLTLAPAALPEHGTALRAKALNGAGVLATQQGDYEQAEVLHRGSLALFRALNDPQGIAAALNNLAGVVRYQGRYAQAATLWEECLSIQRARGDVRRIALVLYNLGALGYYQGQYQESARLFEESLRLRQHLGDTRGIASSLAGLGDLAREQGDYARAVLLLEQAIACYDALADQHGRATALDSLGAVAYAQGDLERALEYSTESLHLLHELGEPWFRAWVCMNLGNVAYQHKDYGRAGALHEESLALRRQMHDLQGIAESLTRLGQVAQARGDTSHAAAWYRESLLIYQRLSTRRGVAACLEGRASILGAEGQAERATRLVGAAAALRQEMGAPLAPIEQASYHQLVTQLRQTLTDALFWSAWAVGQALSLEEALGEALSERVPAREDPLHGAYRRAAPFRADLSGAPPGNERGG